MKTKTNEVCEMAYNTAGKYLYSIQAHFLPLSA
jgi:hypothetical protein